MAKKTTVRPEDQALSELKSSLASVRQMLPTLSRKAANKAVAELIAVAGEIDIVRADLDPIKEPLASFDPGDPDTAGRLVAMALVAQERVPMTQIARTYGSGVYAIYYRGGHPAYGTVSNSETPIYVGKADPRAANARTSREQGPQLFGRLADHRRMIKTVGTYALENSLPHPLLVEDFDCRKLVCATNAQLVAERHLISTFRPVWNNEVGICWGISKHGDSASTRKNKRSPWDVMHPGRPWAMDGELEDKMSVADITRMVADHFTLNPPHKSRARIVQQLLGTFVQHSPQVAVDEEDDALTEAIIAGVPAED